MFFLVLKMTDTLEAQFPYEETPNGFVVRNVKQCPYCGGAVSRFCSKHPDKHFHYDTLYFECASCGAMGDPFLGIMNPASDGMTIASVEVLENLIAEVDGVFDRTRNTGA